MSFLFGGQVQPTESPVVAGIDAADTSTNQQAVPLRWGIGRNPYPLTWIVPQAYNLDFVPITQTTGSGKAKTTTTTGYKVYGDVAGIAGPGLVRRVRALLRGDEAVWTGNVVRNDDPESADYWRAHIATDVGDLYVYWGRENQPVDDILLAALGVADPENEHPAYRGQAVVILKRYYFGDSVTTVPNTVLYLDREPTPAVGVFAPQDSAQGESIVAGMLELATHPIFGAGVPAEMINAAEWQALSAAVVAALGCHSPFLDRPQPLRDVMTSLMLYYGGWARIEQGLIRVGRWPHDGTVPAGLTELSEHDFTERPNIASGSPSTTVNAVDVTYRDAADDFADKTASAASSENVEARKNFETATVEMKGFVDADQAQKWAAESAATGAEGEFAGGLRVRRARARWAGGADLRAGDNFNLDLIAPEVDQVCRITRRTDYYGGATELEVQAEPGVYPTPYVAPADLRPAADTHAVPDPVTARVWELPPDLFGSPLGLPVAVLAKRPKAVGDATGLTTAEVVGFNIHHSGAGITYNVLGHSPYWAVRGTLREALVAGTADVVVKLTLDADNLDRARLAAQSSEEQEDDTLLVVLGDEVFSVGATMLAGLDYDFTCSRARRGSLPAAHALNAEAWVVYRREIRAFIHAAFVEDQDRYFKIQPYTSTTARELADCAALLYHFRDRAPEAPVIVFSQLPSSGAVVGINYQVLGTVSDVNGDLTRVELTAVLYDGAAILAEITLLAADPTEADRALMSIRTRVAFPQAGVWKLRARAWDITGVMTELLTAGINVVEGSGVSGPDDGITPDAISLLDVIISSGVGELIVRWETYVPNTPVELFEVYESTTGVRPAVPKYVISAPQFWVFDKPLTEGTSHNYWFRVKGVNKRYSAYSGPKNATVLVWPRINDIETGLADANADIAAEVLARQTADTGIAATVTTEAAARAADDGTLAAEYVLKVVTDGAGNRRVAGFRITNLGGAGGGTDFVLQADKVAITNATGANQVAPFAVVGGVVYINTAMIGNATIMDAMIDSMLADKLTAGYLNAMKLRASYINTGVQLYHTEDEARRLPTTSHVYDQFNGIGGTSVSDDASWHYLTSDNLIFYGWKREAAGFSSRRFGHPSLRMDMTVAAGVNFVSPGVNTYLQIGPWWRTRSNGGAWGAWQTSGWLDAQEGRVTTLCAHFPANVDSLLDGDMDLQIGIGMQLLNGGPGISAYIYSGGDIWARIYSF